MIRELNVFILFPNSLLDDTFYRLLADTSILIPAYCEKATRVFYDSKHLEYLLDEIKGDYLLEQELRNLIHDFLELSEEKNPISDWSSSYCQKNSHKYYQWENLNIEFLETGSTMREITERMLLNPDAEKHRFLLCHFGFLPISTSRYYCSVLKDETDKNLPVLVKVPCVQLNTNTELEEWIKSNRQEREFKHHKKHNPRGGNIPKILTPSDDNSTLLWEAKDDKEVQALLNDALGDYRITKTLYNWDNVKGCYIIFEDEKTSINGYHAYHIHTTEETRKFTKSGSVKKRLSNRKIKN